MIWATVCEIKTACNVYIEGLFLISIAYQAIAIGFDAGLACPDCLISDVDHLLDYCLQTIGFGVALPRSPKSNSLLGRPNRVDWPYF